MGTQWREGGTYPLNGTVVVRSPHPYRPHRGHGRQEATDQPSAQAIHLERQAANARRSGIHAQASDLCSLCGGDEAAESWQGEPVCAPCYLSMQDRYEDRYPIGA